MLALAWRHGLKRFFTGEFKKFMEFSDLRL